MGAYDPVIHQSNGLIIEVACRGHARRYFEQALPNDSKLCGLVLEWVRQLYDSGWLSDGCPAHDHGECEATSP